MTLDELNTLFDAACNAQQRANSEDVSLWSCRHAGLKVVVEALRDEIVEDGNCLYCVGTTKMYNEILASGGVKSGTHGSPELDEDARKLEAMGQDAGPTLDDFIGVTDMMRGTSAPAAAPDVCEWKRVDGDTLVSGCDDDGLTNSPKIYWDECPNCGLPIKFKEAANEQ
jgi:hypothetical protein